MRGLQRGIPAVPRQSPADDAGGARPARRAPQRLEEWFAIYRDVSGLVPEPPSVAKIGRADWRAYLGHRSRERDYRDFFAGEVARLGIDAGRAAYLPS